MKLAADNLTVRLGLILLAGLIVLQVAILLVVAWPSDTGARLFRLPPPSKVAAMADALEQAGPDLQPQILRALDMDPLSVQLLADYPEGGQGTGGDDHRDAPRLNRLFARYAEDLGGRPFRVQARQGALVRAFSGNEVGAEAPVRVLVELRTGQVLVVERRAPPVFERVKARALTLALVAAAIFAAVLIASVAQTARPVNRLARASRGFSRSLKTEDLPLDGARELRELSAAFNEMKRTIRGLVDERTRILAAVAHDFRTYLTRLRLRIDFIDDDTQRAKATADLDEMAQLIDDALMFARDATTAPPDKAGSSDAVAEARALAAVRRDMGERVDLQLETEAARVACPPLALRRMLGNLLDNAARYAGDARLIVRAEAGQVVLMVEDDGPGAPSDSLSRLTEPFERLEPSRGRGTGGAGLGLSIVRGLAESRGGGLRLENRTEGGLRAVLSLPAA